jgi:uncharacterized iron-regulated protein
LTTAGAKERDERILFDRFCDGRCALLSLGTSFSPIPMKFLLPLLLLVSLPLLAQNPSAYEWYTASGKHTTYDKMLKPVLDADIVLFGEQHDDPIAHWMQLLIARRLFEQSGSAVQIGAEMFERHQQQAIDNFLSGKWDTEMLEDSAKMWSNFETDYLPVLAFAKEHHLPVIATNVTRKYASLVFKKGLAALDTLPEAEKELMCPLPFAVDTTLSQYKELIRMGMEMHASGLDFAYAQAIKDATMAYSILQHWKPGMHFLHLNGAYHSDFHQSIAWYLKKANPDLKIVTISTVSQENVKKLDEENQNKADFILVVPEGMTRTM